MNSYCLVLIVVVFNLYVTSQNTNNPYFYEPYGFGDNGFNEFGLGDTWRATTYLIPTTISKVVSNNQIQSESRFYISTTGQVYAIGDNSNGQLCFPDYLTRNTLQLVPTLTNIVQISVGNQHSMFLSGSGQVFGCGSLAPWGTSATPVLTFNNVTKVSTTNYGTLLLNGNTSTVYSAGADNYGELGLNSSMVSRPVIVAIWTPITFLPSNIIDVQAADWFAMFLTANGSVYATGRNNAGQFGTGNAFDSQFPIYVPLPFLVVKLSTSFLATLFLTNTGVVYGCGSNSFGNLGLGTFGGPFYTPTMLGLTNVTDILAGNQFSVFMSAGIVYTTGSNSAFQLGIAFSTDTTFSTPQVVPISQSVNISGFGVGTFSLHLKTQNGMISIGNPNVPVPPTPLWGTRGRMVQMSSSWRQSLFLSDIGQVWGVGSNIDGSLGLGDYNSRNLISVVPNLGNVTQVSAGMFHSLVLSGNNQIFASGSNNNGQLGTGTDITVSSFIPINGIPGPIQQVYAGNEISFIVTTSGQVWSSGSNPSGCLGLGTTTIQYSFARVLLAAHVVSVSSGDSHSLYLTNTSQAYSAGSLLFGALGTPVVNDSTIPSLISLSNIAQVSAGQFFSLFLLFNGTVYSCGQNGYGGLGVGDNTPRFIPTMTVGLPPIKYVAAGGQHSLFLTQNGLVYGVGWNGAYQLGFPGPSINTPALIPASIMSANITQVIAGTRDSIFFASCPAGTSGPNCTQNVCFGVTALDTNYICSGFGTCNSTGGCNCTGTTSGDQCQNNVYYWRGPTYSGPFNPTVTAAATWSIASNWVVGANFAPTTRAPPNSAGSVVVFDRNGPYYIVIDVPTDQMTSFTFGTADVKLNFVGTSTNYANIANAFVTKAVLLKYANLIYSNDLLLSGLQLTNVIISAPNVRLDGCTVASADSNPSTITATNQVNINGGSITSATIMSSDQVNLRSVSLASTDVIAAGQLTLDGCSILDTTLKANAILTLSDTSISGTGSRYLVSANTVSLRGSLTTLIVTATNVQVAGSMSQVWINATNSFVGSATICRTCVINSPAITLSGTGISLFQTNLTYGNAPAVVPVPTLTCPGPGCTGGGGGGNPIGDHNHLVEYDITSGSNGFGLARVVGDITLSGGVPSEHNPRNEWENTNPW